MRQRGLAGTKSSRKCDASKGKPSCIRHEITSAAIAPWRLAREMISAIVAPQREIVGTSIIKGVRGEPGRAKLRLARGSIGATAYRATGTKQNRKRERRARG